MGWSVVLRDCRADTMTRHSCLTGTIPALDIHTIMKTSPFVLAALTASLFLTSCADVYVSHTDVASGATDPKAIYIRPFDVSQAKFEGHHGASSAERDIRKSLAPADFAVALREELEKIAPAMIIKDDEVPPPSGWLVQGYFEEVHAGSPSERATIGHFGPGRSTIRIHVRILDLEHGVAVAGGKSSSVLEKHGRVLYEFDVAGGSGLTGRWGSFHAPGSGCAAPFDYRNAAERIGYALTVDPYRYGVRTSTNGR